MLEKKTYGLNQCHLLRVIQAAPMSRYPLHGQSHDFYRKSAARDSMERITMPLGDWNYDTGGCPLTPTTTVVDALTPTHLAQSLRFLKRECASPPLPNPTLPVQHLGSTLAQQLGLGASGTGATGSCHILARKSHISQPTAFLKRMKVVGYKFSDIDPVSSGCGTLFPLSSLMKYLLPLEMTRKFEVEVDLIRSIHYSVPPHLDFTCEKVARLKLPRVKHLGFGDLKIVRKRSLLFMAIC